MASPDMTISGTGTGCGNKANDNPGTIGGAGGEGIELITEIQEDDSVTRGIADYIGDTTEDKLYETCVPGEEEDDSLVGPRGGSGLPGAPPQNVEPVDLRLDDHGEEDEDDEELHEGCADGNMTVRYIDMGKGTSILLTAPNGETMLIDAGDDDSDGEFDDIVDAIDEDVCDCRGPDEDTDVIDHFVLSHDHQDHNKYIENLENRDDIIVENWYRPPVPSDEDELSSNSDGVDWTDTKTKGDEIPFGNEVDVEVKHPQEAGSSTQVCDDKSGDSSRSKDCNSLVVEVTHEGHTFLFTGDIKSDSTNAINQLVEDADPEDLGIFEGADVVKIPHHGTNSYNETMIEQIDHTAVISNNDRSGEYTPDEEILRALADRDDLGTYWTAKHGDVLFLVDEDGTLKYVAEHEDGDELDDSGPPSASEFVDDLADIGETLETVGSGALSTATGVPTTAGA